MGFIIPYMGLWDIIGQWDLWGDAIYGVMG